PDGLYSFTGDPFAWYFFNQDGPEPNRVRISCGLRNVLDPTTAGYPVTRMKVTTLERAGDTWTAHDWYPDGGSTLTEEVRARSGSTETLSVSPPGGSVTTQLTRAYTAKVWGEEVGTETLGTSNAVVTDYGYWETVGDQSAAYTRLRSQLSHGAWQAYEYFDYADGMPLAGAVRRQHRPFNNSDTSIPNLASHNGEITTFAYTTDAFGRATRLTQMETTVAGTMTAKTEISYTDGSPGNFPGHPYLNLVTATRKDYSASGAFLTSITKYFREDAGTFTSPTDDFFRARVHSVQRADGVKQSLAYQRGTWDGSSFTLSSNSGLDAPAGAFASRITVITGSATSGTFYPTHDGYDIDDLYLVTDTSEPGVTKHKSTMEVTIRDDYARVVRMESHVRSAGSWQLVGAVNYEWNLANQVVKRATNDSATYSLTAGAIYEAAYDGEFLVSEADEAGIEIGY
ncbi:MAG: hypothetical protein ACREH8_00785, partial [Opitutaceae bacterium]